MVYKFCIRKEVQVHLLSEWISSHFKFFSRKHKRRFLVISNKYTYCIKGEHCILSKDTVLKVDYKATKKSTWYFGFLCTWEMAPRRELLFLMTFYQVMSGITDRIWFWSAYLQKEPWEFSNLYQSYFDVYIWWKIFLILLKFIILRTWNKYHVAIDATRLNSQISGHKNKYK